MGILKLNYVFVLCDCRYETKDILKLNYVFVLCDCRYETKDIVKLNYVFVLCDCRHIEVKFVFGHVWLQMRSSNGYAGDKFCVSHVWLQMINSVLVMCGC